MPEGADGRPVALLRAPVSARAPVQVLPKLVNVRFAPRRRHPKRRASAVRSRVLAQVLFAPGGAVGSSGGERPCATRRCDPRAGVRPAPSSRRSGTTEAGGSWVRRVGRVWWRAAPTTTGRTGTTGRRGSGKRDGKVDARNQRCKAPQDLRQLKPGGSGLDRGAHCPYGQELLDRIDLAGREATEKDCGVTVAMPQGQSWPPHPTSGSQ